MIRRYLRRLYRVIVPLLYSRSRFKLFLNATFADINLRMLTLASTVDYFTTFVRPVAIKAPFGKSMLVVAPHQDDEAIGCGGALVLQIRSGNAGAIVMLQDGAIEHEELGMSRQELRELRNEESRKAAEAIGLEHPRFLNHVQLGECLAQAAEEVCGIITERRVDSLFAPFVLDAHPDHLLTNYIVAKALKGISWEVRVFGYEVWGLCVPNVVVVIDDAIEDKMRMLSCFTYANRAIDYVHSTKGLNMYHSRMLGAGQCLYAERFFELPRKEYIELVERIRAVETRAKDGDVTG
jgi:LmbE family N-acetylglucosaminyl deacetylase